MLRRSSGLMAVLDEVSRGLESLIAEGDNILVVADARGRVLWRSGSPSVLAQRRPARLHRGRALGRGRRRHQRHRHRAGVEPGRAGVLRRALPAQPPPVDVRGRADQGSAHRSGHRRRRRLRTRGDRASDHRRARRRRRPAGRIPPARTARPHAEPAAHCRRADPGPHRAGPRWPSTRTAGWPRSTRCRCTTGSCCRSETRARPGLDPAAGHVRGRTAARRLAGAAQPTTTTAPAHLAGDARPARRRARRHWRWSASSAAGATTSRRGTPRSCSCWRRSARAGRRRELAADLYGDRTRVVTVRAEMSRLRKQFAGLVQGRPYRFPETAVVDVLLSRRHVDAAGGVDRACDPAARGADLHAD